MFHTAYNSYESCPGGRDYIGKHSAENLDDGYLGSFTDQEFDPDSKITMAYAKTAEGAVWFEMNFQNVFDVVRDPQYANRAKQTGTKFDTTGVSLTDGHKEKLSVAKQGEKHPNFGKPIPVEIKEKIGKARSGKCTGEQNPMYGKTGEAHPTHGRTGEKNQNSKKIEVVHPDGTTEVFSCVRLAAERLECSISTLSRFASKTRFPRGKFSGYSFSYPEGLV